MIIGRRRVEDAIEAGAFARRITSFRWEKCSEVCAIRWKKCSEVCGFVGKSVAKSADSLEKM